MFEEVDKHINRCGVIDCGQAKYANSKLILLKAVLKIYLDQTAMNTAETPLPGIS